MSMWKKITIKHEYANIAKKGVTPQELARAKKGLRAYVASRA